MSLFTYPYIYIYMYIYIYVYTERFPVCSPGTETRVGTPHPRASRLVLGCCLGDIETFFRTLCFDLSLAELSCLSVRIDPGILSCFTCLFCHANYLPSLGFEGYTLFDVVGTCPFAQRCTYIYIYVNIYIYICFYVRFPCGPF